MALAQACRGVNRVINKASNSSTTMDTLFFFVKAAILFPHLRKICIPASTYRHISGKSPSTAIQ